MHYCVLAQILIDAIKFCLGKNLEIDHPMETIDVSFYLYTILKDTFSVK